MAVSGTNTFSYTRDKLINAVLRRLKVISLGQTPEPEDYTNCSEALNTMIKSWSLSGQALWTTEALSFTLIAGIREYPVGVLGGTLQSQGITITNPGSGGVDGTYSLSITDATGTGATGSYTVAGGSLTSISISNSGSKYVSPAFSFAASSLVGATVSVIVCGKLASKPLAFADGKLTEGTTESNLEEIARKDFVTLNYKNTVTQTPTRYYFDLQRDTATIAFDSLPNVSGGIFTGQIQRQFFDVNSSTDNLDFPEAWYNALLWGLCADLATEYSVQLELLQYYESKAVAAKKEAFDESVEDVSVYFTVRDF